MNLSLYSPEQEENIYIRRQLHTWQRSGLITDDQFRAVHDETDPQVHQTNLFFRILFFVFTLLCAGAVVGLFVWIMESKGENILASFVLFFSVAFFVMAEYIVKQRRFYRYGIEEALLMAGMVCFVVSILIFIDNYHLNHRAVSIAACLLFAVIACLIFFRFGYLYAALISLFALCAIPFQLSLSPTAERLMLLFVLSAIFVFSLIVDKSANHDFKKNRDTTIQACLLAAIYLTVNLQVLGLVGLLLKDTPIYHLYPKLFHPYIYWSSYVLTFILPAAGIYWGIKSRKRLILNASLVMACITLATNKSYLGMTRYAWDPAILGIVLIALSIIITRWLTGGPKKARYGFTAENILKPEDQGVSLADAAAALAPGAIDAVQPQALQDKYLGGGRSGGGGAERKF